MQSSKDTIRQRKSTRFECFWPIEWTRSTASEQIVFAQSAACRPKGGSSATGSGRGNRPRTRKDKEKALALSAFCPMSGLAQQQAGKCICTERSVQTERWFVYHRQWAMQSSKDTKGKEKALALSAFGPMSGLAQQQASKCICTERSVQTERWFVCHRQWTMQSPKDTIRQRKCTRFECFWLD